MPGLEEVSVYTGMLRREAGVWDEQSAKMATARGAVDAMELGLVEAGVFIPIVNAHNDLVRELRTRCDEGASAMAAVGRTLGEVATTYEAADERAAREIKHVY